jgi:biotin carboxylase
MTVHDHPRPRLVLLFTTTGYEAREFVQAAANLGVETVLGSDRCHVLADPWQDGALPLRFEQPAAAARHIVEYARTQPLQAILPVGDTPLFTAALASQALGLSHNAPEAITLSRNKFRMRQCLRQANIRGPWFACFPVQAEPCILQYQVPYPCVLKPLELSASRGVIRADTPAAFVTAFWRVRALLETPELRQKQPATPPAILVEAFIPGREVALEGLLDSGRLHPLALFDKPDPLDGPFFAETIYVTPSRLPVTVQAAIVQCVEEAAQALGLQHGPVHAELRLNQAGPWLLEIAARAIGGL